MADVEGFYVYPPAIDKLAKLLGDLVDDGQRAGRYVTANIYSNITGLPNTNPGDRFHGFGVMFDEARQALEKVRYLLEENYQGLWTATQGSSYELAGVSKHYKDNDFQAAKRLDSRYGLGGR